MKLLLGFVLIAGFISGPTLNAVQNKKLFVEDFSGTLSAWTTVRDVEIVDGELRSLAGADGNAGICIDLSGLELDKRGILSVNMVIDLKNSDGWIGVGFADDKQPFLGGKASTAGPCMLVRKGPITIFNGPGTVNPAGTYPAGILLDGPNQVSLLYIVPTKEIAVTANSRLIAKVSLERSDDPEFTPSLDYLTIHFFKSTGGIKRISLSEAIKD